MITEAQHDEQTRDIESALVEGVMLRKPLDSNGFKTWVVVFSGGKVVGDFFYFDQDDGAYTENRPAVISFVGSRPSQKSFREQGFSVGRPVWYNRLTNDLEIRIV